jgi:hypothetical protein
VAPAPKSESNSASSSGNHGRVDVRSFGICDACKCAAALAAAARRQCELAALSAAAPANGWAQARDYRASSTLLDERSFA